MNPVNSIVMCNCWHNIQLVEGSQYLGEVEEIKYSSAQLQIFSFYILHPILIQFICKMIIFMGYWWILKNVLILFLKGVKIPTFRIFGRQLFIQFWCGFCFEFIELRELLIQCRQISSFSDGFQGKVNWKVSASVNLQYLNYLYFFFEI